MCNILQPSFLLVLAIGVWAFISILQQKLLLAVNRFQIYCFVTVSEVSTPIEMYSLALISVENAKCFHGLHISSFKISELQRNNKQLLLDFKS